MDNTLDVMIPVDVEAAKAIESPARRAAVGHYLSSLLKGGRVRDVLAEAIAEAKDDKMADVRCGTREGLVTMGRRTSEAAHERLAENRCRDYLYLKKSHPARHCGSTQRELPRKGFAAANGSPQPRHHLS